MSSQDGVHFADVFQALISLTESEMILFEDRFGYGMPNHILGSKS